MPKYGFKANFGKDDVHSSISQYALRIHRALEVIMQYIGEQCVNIAREKGTYNDITGNLRNSIGYVLVRNGDIICKNFEERVQSKIVSAANNSGILEGQALAEELATKYTKGYVLIVVAGMHYAHYVESLNKDVLDSAERYALQKVPTILKDLKKQIYKAAL